VYEAICVSSYYYLFTTRRTEDISEQLNAHDVAEMLWALAKIGRMPGARVMALLERRVEAISGEFDATVDLLCLQVQKYKY
jgi:hypothetical protein